MLLSKHFSHIIHSSLTKSKYRNKIYLCIHKSDNFSLYFEHHNITNPCENPNLNPFYGNYKKSTLYVTYESISMNETILYKNNNISYSSNFNRLSNYASNKNLYKKIDKIIYKYKKDFHIKSFDPTEWMSFL